MLSKLPTISSSSVTQSGCSGSKQTSEYNMNGPHKRRLFILSLFTPWIFDARPHKHIKARKKKRKTLQTHCVSLYRIHNWIHFARADLQTTQWGEGKMANIFLFRQCHRGCVRCCTMCVDVNSNESKCECEMRFGFLPRTNTREEEESHSDGRSDRFASYIFPSTFSAPIH